MDSNLLAYWSATANQVCEEIKSSPAGITDLEARKRLKKCGANSLTKKNKSNQFILLLNQFKSTHCINFRLCGRNIVVFARCSKCIHYFNHSCDQWAAGLLARAQCFWCSQKVTGIGANQSQGFSKRAFKNYCLGGCVSW